MRRSGRRVLLDFTAPIRAQLVSAQTLATHAPSRQELEMDLYFYGKPLSSPAPPTHRALPAVRPAQGRMRLHCPALLRLSDLSGLEVLDLAEVV